MTNILAWLLIFSPLIGLTFWMAWDSDWRTALTVWAIMFGLAAPVVAGLAILNMAH